MANSEVGYHSVVDHCILDEGVRVGQYCYLGFGTTRTATSDWPGIIVGAGAEIPPHTALCRGCRVLPLVGPADFRGRAIPANSVVSSRRLTRAVVVGGQASGR
jgi:acetyltransferase-like isoleucine patch superfamily enzyme